MSECHAGVTPGSNILPMNSTFEDVVQDEMTSAVMIPVGLPGINTFSTSEWWSRAASASERGGARQHRIDQPGAAVVLTPGYEMPANPPVVLMITRPLADWLPIAVSNQADADPTNKLAEWADAVLAWAGFAPMQMVITRTDPNRLSDLCAAVAGRWPVVDSDDHELSLGAEAFRAAMHRRLPERPGRSAELDHLRSQAAIDAVAMATAPSIDTCGDELRPISINVRERLMSAGVRIHGPRTGLVWPEPLGPDLPLDVAAEASLAVILAALDDPSATTADTQDLQAAAALWEARSQAAQHQLSGRRLDPRNLKKSPYAACSS